MKNSPFKDEWLRCQVIHMQSLIEQDDFRNIITFYIVLLENNLLDTVREIHLPYSHDQMAEGIVVYQDERSLRVSKKRTKKKTFPAKKRKRKPTQNEYWYRGETSKEGLKIKDMYPDLYSEEEN